MPSARDTTLGVLGGGQLGRMFVHAAQRMGFSTVVLEPDATSPAGLVSHQHIQADYQDAAALQTLAAQCRAVTTEFENVPAQALAQLATQCGVSPSADAVAIAQDRMREKAHFTQFAARSGVTVAPYAVIETADDVANAPEDLFPAILKTARMGYDGKGQARVRSRIGLERAWDEFKNVPCVLEKMLPLQLECSVIVARGADGQCVHLPVQRNLHRDGILAVTEVYPGNIDPALAQRAQAAAQAIAEGLGYVGVLCVEFFVLDPADPVAQALGGLVVNEMAPRPHNSGHYSMEACDVSQFELQVRTLAGLPLAAPRQHSPAIMLNILGDIWPAGGEPPWAQVLALPGVHLHLYGKTEPRKGRKMGHVTITAATIEQARSVALQVAALLGLEPF